MRYLTADEEQRLLGAMRPDVRAIAEVALHTGIRQGALRLAPVNLEASDAQPDSSSIPSLA